MMYQDVDSFSNKDVVRRIINLNQGLAEFWGSAQGWAPIEAAELLTKSRLDWQASLSRQLRIFLVVQHRNESGALILAWVTLGSLVEGTMKLYLSVWYTNYLGEHEKFDLKYFRDHKGKLLDPDILQLEKLRVFFSNRIYKDWVRDAWRMTGEIDWIEWILKIQQRRNAIHAFQNREIGTFNEFFTDLKKYLMFLRKLTDTFPYPDDEFFKPKET